MNGIKRAIEIGMMYLNYYNKSNGEDVEIAALYKWEGPRTRNNMYCKRTVESLEKFRERYGEQEADDIVKTPVISFISVILRVIRD